MHTVVAHHHPVVVATSSCYDSVTLVGARIALVERGAMPEVAANDQARGGRGGGGGGGAERVPATLPPPGQCHPATYCTSESEGKNQTKPQQTETNQTCEPTNLILVNIAANQNSNQTKP